MVLCYRLEVTNFLVLMPRVLSSCRVGQIERRRTAVGLKG